jgi:hypothetical protein
MQVVGAVGFAGNRLAIPQGVDAVAAKLCEDCWQGLTLVHLVQPDGICHRSHLIHPAEGAYVELKSLQLSPT